MSITIYSNTIAQEIARQEAIASASTDRGEQLRKMRSRIARSQPNSATLACIAIVTADVRGDDVLARDALTRLGVSADLIDALLTTGEGESARKLLQSIGAVTVKDSRRDSYSKRDAELRGMTQEELRAHVVATLPVKAQEAAAPSEGAGEPVL